MIFYSPELNEFCVITIRSFLFNDFGNTVATNIQWCYGGIDHGNERFSNYAWYFVGDI